MLKPLVLRSREEIERSENFPAVLSDGFPIKQDGVRYTMAQEVTWLDEHYFAVGRWDGTLNIFRFNHSSTDGPVITFSVNSPSEEGIQMIVWITHSIFISSNNKESFV